MNDFINLVSDRIESRVAGGFVEFDFEEGIERMQHWRVQSLELFEADLAQRCDGCAHIGI
jgi:hypothetical protein